MSRVAYTQQKERWQLSLSTWIIIAKKHVSTHTHTYPPGLLKEEEIKEEVVEQVPLLAISKWCMTSRGSLRFVKDIACGHQVTD